MIATKLDVINSNPYESPSWNSMVNNDVENINPEKFNSNQLPRDIVENTVRKCVNSNCCVLRYKETCNFVSY